MTRETDENLNLRWAGLVIDELTRVGADTFFISPGSRSAPLVVAAARHPSARRIAHFDERGAAYAALGFARAAGRPAVLVCTSGTAAANYLPAVIEAAQACVPMLLLTADRPPELLDTGANQTIIQPELFRAWTRWRFALPCPDPAIGSEFVLTTVDQAVYRALRAPSGPVHLNCPFREPLAPGDGTPTSSGSWRPEGEPYTRYVSSEAGDRADVPRPVVDALEQAERGLLVVGGLDRPEAVSAVGSLARALGWPVFADITSGLRIGAPEPPFVPYYDQVLLSDALRDRLRPDTVLHVGGGVTSKRLGAWLEASRPSRYVRVAAGPFRMDPGHQVTLRLEMDPARFAHALPRQLPPRPTSSFAAEACALSARVDAALDAFFSAESALSEPMTARLVSRESAPDAALFLGNSMPIRDMDMFADPRGAAARVFANRGVSGIDGNIAAAAGVALGAATRVTAVLGDLAVLHDLNSLALLRGEPPPVTLVAINNDGGGIFHFLPIARAADVFEPWFTTPHGLSLEHAARMFALDYARPATPDAFLEAYRAASASERPALLEVVTRREENFRMHERIRRVVLDALGAS